MSKEKLPTAEEIISMCLNGEMSIVTAFYIYNQVQTAPLLERIKELEEQVLLRHKIYYHMKLVADKNKKLTAENERLREALEWYADSGNYLTDNEILATAWSKNKNIEKKAKEALKGAADEN